MTKEEVFEEMRETVAEKQQIFLVYKHMDPAGKCYIGCTGKPVKERWNSGWGYKRDQPVRIAIDRYGWRNFRKEVLCEKLTREGAEKLEAWFIDFYDSMNPERGYNRFTGGDRRNARVSEESKNKIRESRLRFLEGNPEAALDMRKNANDYYRRHPEVRAAISARMRAYLQTEEGRIFPHACKKPKPVHCVETGQAFRSACAAEQATGYRNIHKVCLGYRQLAGGYHWEYTHGSDRPGAVR